MAGDNHGDCPKCGNALECTGAPIWETYCPNQECTYEIDRVRKALAHAKQAWDRDQIVRDAAPDLLAALKAAKVVIGMMERPLGMGDEVNAALDERVAKIDAAISRATPNTNEA